MVPSLSQTLYTTFAVAFAMERSTCYWRSWTLDLEMKRLQAARKGTKKQAEQITIQEILSQKGLLGDHTPWVLLDTIILWMVWISLFAVARNISNSDLVYNDWTSWKQGELTRYKGRTFQKTVLVGWRGGKWNWKSYTTTKIMMTQLCEAE